MLFKYVMHSGWDFQTQHLFVSWIVLHHELLCRWSALALAWLSEGADPVLHSPASLFFPDLEHQTLPDNLGLPALPPNLLAWMYVDFGRLARIYFDF